MSSVPDPAAQRPTTRDSQSHAVPGGANSPAPKRGLLRRVGATVWAILRHRCPRCHQGRMFRGAFVMNDPCPVCGLLFKREEGTFLGAMYVSYVLAAVLMALLYFPLSALMRRWGYDPIWALVLAVVVFLPFVPILFRYSRTLWIYFERAGSPSGQSATAYEKMRLRELARRRDEAKPEPPTERKDADASNS